MTTRQKALLKLDLSKIRGNMTDIWTQDPLAEPVEEK
jgi:hypothetical protein